MLYKVGCDEIFAITNLEDDISPTLFNIFHCLSIGVFLSAKDEIVRGSNLLYQPLRLHGVVNVNHIYHDVLHFHLHHPRHDTHDHDGEHDDEFRKKRIAAYLQELFLYEIFQCHHFNF